MESKTPYSKMKNSSTSPEIEQKMVEINDSDIEMGEKTRKFSFVPTLKN
eukprot:CAMPEP_0114049296 /NCGR_PEP_ID=MMETSP1339-20121228/56072_1 /TAXON_ID=94617 /ORGANISM="Fibrocapsa japonica" /LENGTH=48 /assembly_acc=CAM_ASM_000762